MSEVSVIIPVYNVENTLSKCLESVIKQTFTDMEIICVNDGSTDKSAEILKEYAEKDRRITILTKENGGLSSARNYGMARAKGEYISFVDSDDYLDLTAIEKLHNNIVTLNTDISMCCVKLFDYENNQNAEDEGYYTLDCFDESFNDKVFSYRDTAEFTSDICVTAWNKLYRRSFLEHIGAKFPDGLIFEDGVFFFSIYFKTMRVSLVREQLYYYGINRKKSILGKGGKQLADIVPVVNMMCESLKNSGIFEKAKNDFYKKKARDIIYRFQKSDRITKRLITEQMRNYCVLFDETMFASDYISKEMYVEYFQLCEIRNGTELLPVFLRRLKKRFMKKLVSVLFTENDNYYFKFWDLKFKIRKKPFVLDIMEIKDGLKFKFFKSVELVFKCDIRYWRRISK